MDRQVSSCRSDEENISLCHTFSNFFADKIISLKRAVDTETVALVTPFFLFCFLRAVISALWPFCPVEHLSLHI